MRKFFFFLDPMKKGRIDIRALLTSPILPELYELRQEAKMYRAAFMCFPDAFGVLEGVSGCAAR